MALPIERQLSPEERDRLLARAAEVIVRRRMEVPAVLALEMHRPLTFLGSQAMVVLTPALAPLFGLENLQQLAALLDDRANLDRLLDEIERRCEARDNPETSGEPGPRAAEPTGE